MWAAISSVVGTFLVLSASSDWCLARSLAALVLDVIFGNYTLTYIYIVVSFILFFSSSPSSFLVFFLITLLLIPFLSPFFLLLFIVNNQPPTGEPNSLPLPLSPHSRIPLIPFVMWTFFFFFFWRLHPHPHPPLSIPCLVHPLHLNIVYHPHPPRASTAAAVGAE